MKAAAPRGLGDTWTTDSTAARWLLVSRSLGGRAVIGNLQQQLVIAGCDPASELVCPIANCLKALPGRKMSRFLEVFLQSTHTELLPGAVRRFCHTIGLEDELVPWLERDLRHRACARQVLEQTDRGVF